MVSGFVMKKIVNIQGFNCYGFYSSVYCGKGRAKENYKGG